MKIHEIISLIENLDNPYSKDFFECDTEKIKKIIPDENQRTLVAFFFCNYGYEAFRLQLLDYLKLFQNNISENKTRKKS